MIWDKDKYNSVVPRGSGECFDCRGTGKIAFRDYRCRDCKGSGRCKWCGGTGIHKNWMCEFCSNNNDGIAQRLYYENILRHIPLDEVLAAISEEELARIVGKPCDAARESFTLERMTVSSGEELDRILGSFMTWYCPRVGCHEYLHPDDPARGADHILSSIHGDSLAVLMIAKTGEAGGLKSLLDSIHGLIKKRMSKDYAVKHVLNYFDFPERERLIQQYIDNFPECLPWRFRGQRAVILANTGGFKEIMLHHSAVVEPALRAEAERA